MRTVTVRERLGISWVVEWPTHDLEAGRKGYSIYKFDQMRGVGEKESQQSGLDEHLRGSASEPID